MKDGFIIRFDRIEDQGSYGYYSKTFTFEGSKYATLHLNTSNATKVYSSPGRALAALRKAVKSFMNVENGRILQLVQGKTYTLPGFWNELVRNDH